MLTFPLSKYCLIIITIPVEINAPTNSKKRKKKKEHKKKKAFLKVTALQVFLVKPLL